MARSFFTTGCLVGMLVLSSCAPAPNLDPRVVTAPSAPLPGDTPGPPGSLAPTGTPGSGSPAEQTEQAKSATMVAYEVMKAGAATADALATGVPPTSPPDWTLAASLPPGPEEAGVYWLLPITQTVTADEARRVAERFDLATASETENGGIGVGGFVFDSADRGVRILSTRPLILFYASNAAPTANFAPAGSLAQTSVVAEEFLAQRGLLDFEYRIEPLRRVEWRESGIAIVPLVEGIPLYEGYLGQPRIFVALDTAGQVSMMYYERLNLQRLQATPLITAEQAVSGFLAGDRSRVVGYRAWNPYIFDLQEARRDLGGPPLTLPLAPAVVSQVDLVYQAPDTVMSPLLSDIPNSTRQVLIPCWRLAGSLAGGRTFEILVSAVADETDIQLPGSP